MRDVPCATALQERATILLDAQQFQLAAADIDRLLKLQGETAPAIDRQPAAGLCP